MPQYEDYWPLEEPEEEDTARRFEDPYSRPYSHPKERYDSEYNYIGEESEPDYD